MKKPALLTRVPGLMPVLFSILLSAWSSPGWSVDEPRYDFDIPEQSLDEALFELSSQSGVNVLGQSRLLRDRRSGAVSGTMTLEQALRGLLAGTPLLFEITDYGSVIIFAPETKPKTLEKPDPETAARMRTYEILVSGIRRSLTLSAQLKEQAEVILDVITAEDVGRFPDPNVAEALQRVTGVQISRDRGGEGRWVSIRGLSSQFNMTRLNGRTIATDNAGRDFSFDVMPSEAIARAEVYKSPMASLPEGSIGGMVNLETVKPLDELESRAYGSVGAFYDDSTGHWTKQASGLVTHRTNDQRLGLSAGVSYYERDWRASTFDTFLWSMEPVDSNGDQLVQPGVDGRAAFPGIISYQVKQGERTRLGLTGSVQFRPNGKLETTVDAFYSDYETPETAYAFNVNFYSNNGPERLRDIGLSPFEGGGVDRWLLTNFALDNIPLEVGSDSKARRAETYMLGSNTLWQPRKRLELELDVAYSEAKRPIRGQEYFTVAGVPGGRFRYDARAPVPTVQCRFADGRDCLTVGNDALGLHFLEPKGEDVNDDVLSFRLDGRYQLGKGNRIETLRLGTFVQHRDKAKVLWRPEQPCAFCGFGDALGEVGVDATVPFPGAYQYDVGFSRWPAVNPSALFDAARRHAGSDFFQEAIAPRPQRRSSFSIEEDVAGAYWQLDLAGDGWNGNLGVRWTQTETRSSGHAQSLLQLREIANSTNWNPLFTEAEPVVESNRYDNWLPSLNLRYELPNDWAWRFAVSRAMTRPTISQLGPDVNWEVNSPPPRVERNGNPSLDPFVANSFDSSLEWYGRGGNSAALAVFYKDVDGLIREEATELDIPVSVVDENGVVTEQALRFDITEPVNGGEAAFYGTELAFQYLWTNGFGVNANYTFVDTRADEVAEINEVTGVSRHTYNLVGLYEKGPLGVRVAWNYRDDYLACYVCGPDGGPSSTKAFGSLDFSVNYRLGDALTVYLEGQNLLEDDNHTYSRDRRLTSGYEAYPRRFEVGLRAKFR